MNGEFTKLVEQVNKRLLNEGNIDLSIVPAEVIDDVNFRTVLDRLTPNDIAQINAEVMNGAKEDLANGGKMDPKLMPIKSKEQVKDLFESSAEVMEPMTLPLYYTVGGDADAPVISAEVDLADNQTIDMYFSLNEPSATTSVTSTVKVTNKSVFYPFIEAMTKYATTAEHHFSSMLEKEAEDNKNNRY